MAIDLATEQVQTLHQATRLFPPYRDGQPTHVSRVIRAIQKGSLDVEGTRVRLEAIRLGSQWVTSVEAVQRWAERLAHGQSAPATEPRTPTARRKAHERAEAELDRAGI